MSKKKTHKEYVTEVAVKNPNIQVVGLYVNAKTAIEHYCVKHNVYWNITPNNVLNGYGCPECKKEKIQSVCVKSHEQYIDEVKIINQNINVVEKYINAKTPIKHYCKIHNIFWDAAPDNILQGGGWIECGKEKSCNGRRKSHEKYVEEVASINMDIEVVGEYINAHTPILHRCKIDGHEWMALPMNIIKGVGCPQCNQSHGEKQIYQWLDNHHIKYIPQKIFDDCRNKKPLPFDFYIPTYNICIEYDGEQHFRIVDYFGGEDGFKQRKNNDEIKNQYCKNNNIHLLRIPYFKNIEEELEQFFIHLI